MLPIFIRHGRLDPAGGLWVAGPSLIKQILVDLHLTTETWPVSRSGRPVTDLTAVADSSMAAPCRPAGWAGARTVPPGGCAPPPPSPFPAPPRPAPPRLARRV